MPVQAHVVALAGGHLSAGLILAGSLLMAVATVLGALLALRRPGRHEAWLGAAAGALLVIAGLHLLPDAWSRPALPGSGRWPFPPPRWRRSLSPASSRAGAARARPAGTTLAAWAPRPHWRCTVSWRAPRWR